MAIKVKLRQKPISGNRQSLYLDFYPPIPHPKTGKPTRREFLGLYLFDKTKNPIDKQHNSDTIRIAESIRQKRENFLNKPEIYSGYEKEKLRIKELGERDFVKYFEGLANKRKSSNHDNWVSALHHFKTFAKGEIKFADLNEKLCNDFKEHLLSTKSKKDNKKKLSQNTALSYFNKFKAALKQAYKDGYLTIDLNAKIAPIKEAETHREYLSLEELKSLVKTESALPIQKKAALFSALTGLRFSDIEKLIWGEIQHSKETGYHIRFMQKKTKGAETMPISEQAYNLLGEPGESSQKVFEGLEYSTANNEILREWVKKAGIKKHITFHSFRHTFATLQLTLGTDIYTVSKMLGHKDLKTTQIYAKIIDEKKREAADKIKLDI